MLVGLPQPHIIKMDCGSCRKCCRGEAIILTSEDDPNSYQCHEPKPGVFILDRKPGGDCIYLGEQGCTIWGRHPEVCRVFNCVDFVKRLDEGAYAGFAAKLETDVTREGRRRLRQREQVR